MSTITRPFLSVRVRLLVLTTSVLALTLVVAGVASHYLIAGAERKLWDTRQQAVAQGAGNTVGDFLRITGTVLPALGAIEADDLAREPAITGVLLNSQPALRELIRTDGAGQIFAAAASDQALLSSRFTLSQASWFQQARAGQDYLSPVQLSSQGDPYVIMARGAPDGGVVAARLDLHVLREVVDDLRGDNLGYAYVLEQNGRLLVHSAELSPGNLVSLADRPEFPLLLELAEQGTSASYTNFAGDEVFGTAAPIAGANLIVVTEVPASATREASQAALLLLTIGPLIFGALVMGLTSLLLGRLIFRPLESLQKGAAAVARGDYGAVVPVRRHDELGQVAAAFNLMAEAVRSREQRLTEQAAGLEQEVLARTADLRSASEARQRLEAETVRQAKALIALSTPLIPVSDELLVLPVIGTFDRERLALVQAALTAGLERRRVRAVILDITGAALMDEDGAAGLVRMARIAELVGVKPILTGISPELAQALVSLGTNLDQITTFSTLQEAIRGVLLQRRVTAAAN